MMHIFKQSNDRAALTLILLSCLSWCTSLVLPALMLGTFAVYGWQFLVEGWRGLAALSIGGVSWLANPLLLASWLSLLAPRYLWFGVICAWLAALAALTSFLFNALGGGGGAGLVISDYGIGFHLWLAAAFISAIGQSMRLMAQQHATG